MPFNYVPQMVDLEAEFSAVNNLRSDIRTKIKPYLIVRRPKVPMSSKNAKVALGQRATECCDKLFKSWDLPSLFDEGLSFFIDGQMLDAYWLRTKGTHPFDFISSRLRNMRCRPTPAVRMNSSPEYKKIVHYLAVVGGEGCCLRVPVRIFRNSDAEKQLRDTQESLDLDFDQIDLMLDCGYLVGDIVNINQLLKAVPFFDRWRNVIFAGGSIPRLNSQYHEGTNYQPRYEWNGIGKLIADDPTSCGKLIFSDSGTRHFNHDVHSENRRGATVAKYTVSKETVILKGKFRKTGSPAPDLQSLAKMLTDMKGIYNGSDYCAGDEFFKKCSTALNPIADRRSWIAAELNHHITRVTLDIGDLRSRHSIAA